MSKKEPKHPSKTPASDAQSTEKGSGQLSEKDLAQVSGGHGTGGGAGKVTN